MKTTLNILYGTHTGNAERLAVVMARKCREQGVEAVVANMADLGPADVAQMKNVALIVSTHGLGEPPVQASDLYASLLKTDPPALADVRYAVLALGDSGYSQFCQAGKDFDHILKRLGARQMLERIDCDVDYADSAVSWIDSVLSSLRAA